MPTLLIEGISVDFPYEPYECQREYMKMNIIALKNGQNALLESPTGTGKTLCLLCSTLAFQAYMYARMKRGGVALEYAPGASRVIGADKPPSDGARSGSDAAKEEVRPPTIIYASRTHSQITQVVRELRSTSYKVKMTVLASRDQLCVEPKVSKLRGSALNFACNRKNSGSTCSFKRNLDQYKVAASDGVSHPSFDVEDLVNIVGKQDKVCPYFYTREEAKNAEIVLLPYNYLFDPEVRKTLSVSFTQSIIILDEGHNIEKVAADAASFTFTTTMVAQCISELQDCLRHIHKSNPEDGNRHDDAPRHGSINSDAPPPSSEAVTHMLRALFDVERAVDSVPLGKFLGNSPSCVLAGRWMAELFEQASITHEKSGFYINEMRVAGKFIMSEMMDAVNKDGDSTVNVNIPEPKLVAMSNYLARVFRTTDRRTNIERAQDYKVFICEEGPKDKEKIKTNNNPQYNSRFGGPTSRTSAAKKRIVNFWAFTSGIAMEELRSFGVRSFIITSGTLSPLEAFKDDMKIPFQVQLENPHVIDNNQLWVGALTTGASGKKLNSSYENQTDAYRDEMGLSVLQICQTMYGHTGQQAIPQGVELRGGVLLFFPSYNAMDSTLARWKQSGLLDSLCNYGGPIIVEPRAGIHNKSAAKPTPFTGTVDKSRSLPGGSADPFENPSVLGQEDYDGGESGDAVIKGIVSELEAALRSHSRCLVMAVCRGKVSEGIDFKDERGRVVIITGIPFAPTMDPWVKLKQDFLDERCGRPTNSSISANSSAHFFGSGASAAGGRPPATGAMASYGSIVGGGSGAQGAQQGAAICTSIPIRSAPYPNPNPNNPGNSNSSFAGARVLAAAEHMQPALPKPKGILDGRGWYLQAASRAVNQAIGRVIRHRHDWGCIFLLDERFPQSNQKSQLSSWVRPRVQAFIEYRSCLASFRTFVSAAMAKPELNPTTCLFGGNPNTTIEVKPVNVRIKPKADPGSALDAITRQVLLEASALPGAEGGMGYASYISPELLLTQNIETVSRRVTGAQGVSSRSSVAGADRVEASDELADLESIFHFGGTSSGTESSSSSSFQSMSSNAAPLRMANIFSRQHRVINSTSSSTKIAPSNTPLLLAASQPVRANVLSLRPAPMPHRAAPAPAAVPNQESNQTLGNKTVDFRAVVCDIKTVLTEERFISFTLLCRRARETHLSTINAVKDFAERLRGVFVDVDMALAGPLMHRLAVLVDSNAMLQALYAQHIMTILSNMRYDKGVQQEKENEQRERRRREEEEASDRKRTAEAEAAKVEATKKAKAASLQQKPSDINVDLNKAPVQTVVVMAEDGVTPIMQTNYSNFFARKPHPNPELPSADRLSQRPQAQLSQSSIHQPSQRALSNLKSSSSSVLQCGVCLTVPPSSAAAGAPVYLAARCGHICCKQCWGQLLQRKQPCPTCRTPVSQIQLTKVVLK